MPNDLSAPAGVERPVSFVTLNGTLAFYKDEANAYMDAIAAEMAALKHALKIKTEVCEDAKAAMVREHDRAEALEAMVVALYGAMVRAERKMSAYVGVCKGDKELTDAVLPMSRATLAVVTSDPLMAQKAGK